MRLVVGFDESDISNIKPRSSHTSPTSFRLPVIHFLFHLSGKKKKEEKGGKEGRKERGKERGKRKALP